MAVHFANRDEKYLITTNYKVWFSTLTFHKNLVRTFCPVIPGYKHYFLVRNPYDRLESFYKDKLFDAPASATFSESFNWQNCQQLFINKFGNINWSFDEQRKYLLSITFNDFIDVLDQIYCLDVHLVPQTFSLETNCMTNFLEMKFDKVLKVEMDECLCFLKEKLKIDTSIRRNTTMQLEINLHWTTKMRAIVNDLFKNDFEVLGYPTID